MLRSVHWHPTTWKRVKIQKSPCSLLLCLTSCTIHWDYQQMLHSPTCNQPAPVLALSRPGWTHHSKLPLFTVTQKADCSSPTHSSLTLAQLWPWEHSSLISHYVGRWEHCWNSYACICWRRQLICRAWGLILQHEWSWDGNISHTLQVMQKPERRKRLLQLIAEVDCTQSQTASKYTLWD